MQAPETRWIEAAHRGRPKPGEQVSGDACSWVARETFALCVMVDGLGHGPEANEASSRACAYAEEHADEPVGALLRGLDRVLVGTRGAAASLLRIDRDAAQVSFAGIGNVEVRARTKVPMGPVTVPGILGRGLRTVRVWEYEVHSGDVFAVFTDGVSSRLDIDAEIARPLPTACAALLGRHQSERDDATVMLVRVRCVGPARTACPEDAPQP